MNRTDDGRPKPTRRRLLYLLLIVPAVPAAWYLFAVARARITFELMQGLAGHLLSVLFFIAAASWLGSALFPGWRERRKQRRRDRPEAAKPSAGAAVIVHESGVRPRRLRLEAGENVAGTAAGCEIRLTGKGIAPRHLAVVVSEDGTAMVRDLGTGLPSTRNGKPLGAVLEPFGDGDTVTLGKIRLERAGG
jgi:hypothetical protein